MEITYFTDGVVWVTNQRVVFVRTTYFLHDILSVSIDSYRTSRPWLVWLTLSIAGWLMLAAGIVATIVFSSVFAVGACLFAILLLLFFALIPLTFYAVGGLRNQPNEDFFYIKLRDSHGPNLVYASFDRDYLDLILESIDFALNRSATQPLLRIVPRW